MNSNLNIIISPILSEKSSKMMEALNKYVFKVCVTANKLQIKNEIETRFKVEILKVSTMNFNGKRTARRFNLSFLSGKEKKRIIARFNKIIENNN